MSVVCILTPVVIASWPAFSAAVIAASASLGYASLDVKEAARSAIDRKRSAHREVILEIAQSELVTDTLDRGRKITVSKDGVSVTFSRDARGKAGLHVEGTGHSEEVLRACGEELGQRVVQRYVYQRLMDEMKERNYLVVEEQVQEDASIRLRVRHWDN